jgi:hypothetical protein
MAATAIPIPNSGEVVASSWGAAVAAAHNGIQAGQVPTTGVTGTFQNIQVTFPRPYSAPPIVVVGIGNGTAALTTARYYALASVVTTTGFLATIQHADNLSAAIPQNVLSWVAIGLP